ncbi:MAG TPA: HAMP domain-containing sensor histidine kinase, partial [Solirubrobacteraceae bacterium]|nr:HAMP domain-containing sensor histidine kinase [Solirubrobacteraceae bacterium]
MPLRRRLGLVAASAVGIAVVIAACVCYFVVRSQLRDQVDSSLRAQASEIPQTVDAARFGMSLSPNAGGPAPYGQLDVPGNNPIALTNDDLALPVTSGTEAVITGRRGVYLADITLDGSHLREITVPVEITSTGARGAVQLARPLDGVDHILSQLRVILFLVLLGGVGLAAVLGRLAAKRVLKPLSKVSETAQLIAETDDLTRRIDVHEDDEVGQLATRFNAMLARLEHSREELDASVAAQRQLVADASHELRTPVTSLRTNAEMLRDASHVPDDDRREIAGEVVEQAEELTALIGDLIDLARGDVPDPAVEDVRLDQLAYEAVQR